MQRYAIIPLPGATRKFVILDAQQQAYCSLSDVEDPTSRLPLEWKSPAAAEAWLQRCYKTWRQWEERGDKVPDNWEPYNRAPKDSPFVNRRYPDSYYR